MAKRIRQQSAFTLHPDIKDLLVKVSDKRGQTYSKAIERMIIKAAKEEGIIPDVEGK